MGLTRTYSAPYRSPIERDDHPDEQRVDEQNLVHDQQKIMTDWNRNRSWTLVRQSAFGP